MPPHCSATWLAGVRHACLCGSKQAKGLSPVLKVARSPSSKLHMLWTPHATVPVFSLCCCPQEGQADSACSGCGSACKACRAEDGCGGLLRARQAGACHQTLRAICLACHANQHLAPNTKCAACARCLNGRPQQPAALPQHARARVCAFSAWPSWRRGRQRRRRHCTPSRARQPPRGLRACSACHRHQQA